jgi:hypothetical protein
MAIGSAVGDVDEELAEVGDDDDGDKDDEEEAGAEPRVWPCPVNACIDFGFSLYGCVRLSFNSNPTSPRSFAHSSGTTLYIW